jgi:N-acetylglutamate synthase-like GNAT family acetyltransferase
VTRQTARTPAVPRQKPGWEFVIRTARRDEARQIYDLIMTHLKEGHLLPREIEELTLHAERFVVVVDGYGAIVACGELAPLSHTLAEVRSFVVSRRHRGSGLGRRMIEELRRRAHLSGFESLCAFTHQPAYFLHLDFSIVPHTWLPEKISADCRLCSLFRRCGQYAMLAEVEPVRHHRPSYTSLHA